MERIIVHDPGQAQGFFYLKPEAERDAVEAAITVVRDRLPEFEDYLGAIIAQAALDALTIEDLLGIFRYSVHRDGEGRIVDIRRQPGFTFSPDLEGALLEPLLRYTDGARIVFTDGLGNGWEWKSEAGEITFSTGHVHID